MIFRTVSGLPAGALGVKDKPQGVGPPTPRIGWRLLNSDTTDFDSKPCVMTRRAGRPMLSGYKNAA